jgi:hypothetical protein
MTSESLETPTFFVSSYAPSFGNAVPDDDLLHPAANAKITDYACTETQYLGFNIPEADISGVNYIWHHPHLKQVLGGSVVYKGIKRQIIASELCDIRSFMRDDALAGDLRHYKLDTGTEVRIIEPLKKLQLRYDDPLRKNHFDVTLTAIMPPAMWPTGRHFEQAMKTEGKLTLRGEKYDVRGYFIRDRSWGEARSEINMPIPATSWLTGTFNDGFAFNCNAVDHPDLNPLWKGHFEIPEDKLLFGGWIWLDGELTPIISARKHVDYDISTLIPRSVDLSVVDAKRRKFAMHGTIRSAIPFNCWMNVHAPICLTRWECRGLTGWGDTQDIQWSDFVQACLRP